MGGCATDGERRQEAGGGGRREAGEGESIQGEAADAAVREEDTVRGEEAERGEAA